MAKIPFGILGPVIGSLGPVTGKTWKDKATLSSHRKPAKTDKNPTPAQLNQREKFGFVSRFLNGLGPLVKKTFKELANGKTESKVTFAKPGTYTLRAYADDGVFVTPADVTVTVK